MEYADRIGILSRRPARNRKRLRNHCASKLHNTLDDLVRRIQNQDLVAVREAYDSIRRCLNVLDQVGIEYDRDMVDTFELNHSRLPVSPYIGGFALILEVERADLKVFVVAGVFSRAVE